MRSVKTQDGLKADYIGAVLHRRVALLTHALSPHRLALVEKIASGVQTFHVFLSQHEDKLHGFALDRGTLRLTHLTSLNWRHHFQHVHGYSDLSHINLPVRTVSQLSRFRPDLIVSTELGMRSVQAALYKVRFPNTRLILWATLSERTEATRGALRRTVRRWLLKKADCVLVNGAGGERYVKTLGCTAPIHVVPYAIDGNLFRTSTYRAETNTLRILYTGQLIPRKGLLPFCSGLNTWCQNHPHCTAVLTLVGDGPERSSLAGMITAPNMLISVQPRTSQQKFAQLYEGADISVLPTLGDEWGVAVNESLIAGRPVLGSIHSQAVTELIVDGVNGWTWDPEQSHTLQQALSRAFHAKPEQLERMSEACKRSADTICPTVVGERVLNAFRDLLCAMDGTAQ